MAGCGCGKTNNIVTTVVEPCNYTISDLNDWIEKIIEFSERAVVDNTLYSVANVSQLYVLYLRNLYQSAVVSNDICQYNSPIQQSEGIKNNIFNAL